MAEKRRKSLLVSTLKAYFEGRKELFKGLAIDRLETEWTVYPVIRIDLSSGKYYEIERLHGTICGITEQELMTQLKPDIEWLSEAISKYMPTTYDETVAELKRMYDGYHFSRLLTDVYNPWSLFYAFDKGWIDNYWFSTGTSSSLISLLRVKQFSLPELEGMEVEMKRFDAPTERVSDPVPALYQSGYLTIKGYNPMTKRYTLGFPNEEVYQGFADSLYQYFMEDYIGSRDQMNNAFWDLRLKKKTFEQFLEAVRFAPPPSSRLCRRAERKCRFAHNRELPDRCAVASHKGFSPGSRTQ